MLLITFLALFWVCACQFINYPQPFNPADTYVAPTATEVVTFGGAPEVTATDFHVSSITPVYESSTTGGPSSSIAPSVEHGPSLSLVSVDFGSGETQAASFVTDKKPLKPTVILSTSSNPPHPPTADFVTVVNTFYTTLSCSPTASVQKVASTEAHPKVTSVDWHLSVDGPLPGGATRTSSSLKRYSPISRSHTTVAPVSVSPSSASVALTSPACSADRSTVYSTLFVYSTETSSSIVTVTSTVVTTIAL